MPKDLTKNINIDLTEYKSDIITKMDFCSQIEKDIFNFDDIKNSSPLVKIEYYKLAKSALMNDLNFLKGLPPNAEDELLRAAIASLSKKNKEKLKLFLIEISKQGD